jgi:TetR/AcrR family transcriptional regulator of autoinduction and epiphytic fitness
MVTSKAPKVSFKAQMLLAREQALIDVVNRLLAEKGFEAMTVDEVAAEVGIAKASLYKHFPSKEDLAAAAMAHLMSKALAFVQRPCRRAERTQQAARHRGLDHAAQAGR